MRRYMKFKMSLFVCAVLFCVCAGCLYYDPSKPRGIPLFELGAPGTSLYYPITDKESYAFFHRSMKFDYCGSWDSETVAISPEIQFAPDILMYNWTVLSLSGRFYLELSTIQDLCEGYESAVYVNNSEDATVYARRIRENLLFFAAQWDLIEPELGYAKTLFKDMIFKVEYMLARLINNGQKIPNEQILQMLPDEIFLLYYNRDEEFINRSFRKDFIRGLVFRNMLLIGNALTDFQRETQHCPKSLDELPQVLAYQEVLPQIKILYSTEGSQWQLFASVKPGTTNPLPFNKYKPNISLYSEPPMKTRNSIWFSPDFSRKRRDLYVHGKNNDGYRMDSFGRIRELSEP